MAGLANEPTFVTGFLQAFFFAISAAFLRALCGKLLFAALL